MEKAPKTVTVVGGGIGGLASALLLAKQGYKVSLYEKNECLGGRASIMCKDGYTFDMGPSRYLMPDIFEEFFKSIDEDIHDYLDLKQLSPSYRVFYSSGDGLVTPHSQSSDHHLQHLDIYADSQRMSDIFESMEPGAGKQFLTFLDRAKIQYEIGMEFCKKNYDSIFDFFRRDIMWKGIKLNIRTTIDHYVARFFKNQLIRKIMQYTTVFLGTAPKQTPALYNIMSHCDFNMGVRYPKGGLHEIAKTLHQIGLKYGVEYHLNTEVVGCEIKDNQMQSLKIKSTALTKSLQKKQSILIINNHSKHIHELERLIQNNDYIYKTIPSSDICAVNVDNFDCVILSGGSFLRPVSDHPEDYTDIANFIMQCNKLIIGICLGAQIIAHTFGSMLSELEEKVDGLSSIILDGTRRYIKTIEHHRFAIKQLGPDLSSIAHSDYGIEIFKHNQKSIYGFQYHPECNTNDQQGDEVFGEILGMLLSSSQKESKQIPYIHFYDQATRDRIISGKKTIETRALNPEELERYFGNIANNDLIRFVNKDTNEVIQVKVIKTYYWKNLEDYSKSDSSILLSVSPHRSITELNSLEKIKQLFDFTPNYVDKIEKNGLIGWEFEIIGEGNPFVKQIQKENIIILHGFTGLPTTNFIPWLKKELEDLGYSIEVPLLPDTNAPNILKQIEYVKKNCTINENTIIIGHSLGSIVAQKIAEGQYIKGMLLVSGFADLDFIDGNGKDRAYANTFDWKFDFDIIKLHCEWIDILHDSNDRGIGIWQFERIQTQYGAGKVVVANRRHFIAEEEPEILKILMNHLDSSGRHREIKESDNFVISSLDPSRREEYKALRLEALRHDPEAFGGNYEEMITRDDEYRKSRLISTNNTLLFAESVGGKLIGTINYTIDGYKAKIYGMYINKDYRGLGAGKRLLDEVKKQASLLSVTKLSLRVYKTQSAAIALYTKYGFSIAGEGVEDNGKEYYEMDCLMELNDENGGISIQSDIYLINADMAWFETSVLPKESQTYPKSYRDSKIFAPSGFIIYAGVNKKLPKLDHHNLYFCEDRDKNFGQIFDTKELPEDPSIYVSKITHTDPSMAPEGCENLFILVPIPNGIEISDNQKEQYKNMVWGIVEQMAGENIVGHIKVEEVFTVNDFKSRYNSWKGTALGLAHPIMQTAVFRPNNISKKLDNLFYVGHNTNPGIGVPMVIISAQLALERIMKKFTL